MSNNNHEDDQNDRDNYSLVIVNLLDTDLEDNSKITVLCYLNGELDDTIKIKGSTTIFIHKNDLLAFEVKDQSPPQTIGVIEITMLQLLSESDKIFQKWLPAVYNQKMHKILLEFEIQKMGTLTSSKMIRNQTQQNEDEILNHKKSSQQGIVQSSSSNSDKYLPCIQSTQLNNNNNQTNNGQFNRLEEFSHQEQHHQSSPEQKEYLTFLENDLGQNNGFNQVNGNNTFNNNLNKDDSQNNNKGLSNKKEQQQQQLGSFTISPIKVIKDQTIKNDGYQFQKLGQNNQLIQSQNNPEIIINKTEDGFVSIQDKLTNSASPNANQGTLGVFQTDQQHVYDILEEELVKLTKTIQNKNFNSLIDKRRQQYLELKNLLKDITEQFETLKRHPCRSCEKKYIPSIQKGIQKLYSGYKQLMDLITLSQQQQSIQQQQQQLQASQKQQQPINEFIQSLPSSKKQTAVVKQNINSRSKSPISSSRGVGQSMQLNSNSSQKLQKTIGNIPASQLSKTSYGMSPNHSKKIDKLKDEEQKAYDLQMNSNFIRDQLESQFKKTNELETENKQLKLRNFILEADLKNLLKRIQQEKLTFSTRATFKMQEFRQIFEYFHSLRLERESLLDEIHQLQDELNINNGDNKKNHKNNINNNNNSNSNQKSIQQSMREYTKQKNDTLSSIQKEEQRIENELAERRHSNITSSSYYQPHYSHSLSPKPKAFNNNSQQDNLGSKRNNNEQLYSHSNNINSNDDHLNSKYINTYEGEYNDLYPSNEYQQNGENKSYKKPSLLNNNYTLNQLDSNSFNPNSYSKNNNINNQNFSNYDNKSKEFTPSSTSSARNEIHHLLNQRKNVINELLEKIGEF